MAPGLLRRFEIFDALAAFATGRAFTLAWIYTGSSEHDATVMRLFAATAGQKSVTWLTLPP